MDDNAKNASSYHLDQEILDARGIKMTVEEVAGLSTSKYSERVQSLKLSDGDLAFLKGLRRRIKNRLASQNSRRRSMENLRRLTRELRAVRACRDDALSERRSLLRQRAAAREKCRTLRRHVIETLKERLDDTEVPVLDIDSESHTKPKVGIPTVDTATEKSMFECRLEKLVQQSVNHIYKTDKKVYAKTVFLPDEKEIKCQVKKDLEPKYSTVNAIYKDINLKVLSDDGVLNLSMKESKRKSHGRKQSAPRRIAYVECEMSPDEVLDLKIKREPQ